MASATAQGLSHYMAAKEAIQDWIMAQAEAADPVEGRGGGEGSPPGTPEASSARDGPGEPLPEEDDDPGEPEDPQTAPQKVEPDADGAGNGQDPKPSSTDDTDSSTPSRKSSHGDTSEKILQQLLQPSAPPTSSSPSGRGYA